MRLPTFLHCLTALVIVPLCAAEPAPTSRQGAAAATTMTSGDFTEHDYRRTLHQFNRRTSVDAYDTAGRRDPKWDDEAKAFLEAMALSFSNAGAGEVYQLPG